MYLMGDDGIYLRMPNRIKIFCAGYNDLFYFTNMNQYYFLFNKFKSTVGISSTIK